MHLSSILKKNLTTFTTRPNARIYFGVGLVLFLVLWVAVVSPYLTKIPKDFEYTANIFSLDNFYDQTAKKFLGEKRSVTTFTYETESQQDGVSEIKNIFDVRAATGEKIFAVERVYGVEAKTGKHVAGHGDKDRLGYLFGPRNLKKGEPFFYWHINYDAPAEMTFVAEENLFGLKVYRYETNYADAVVDQTQELSVLPDVGVTRGIVLEPYLQLWIEPVTGRLVKYADQTTAYYYNLASGERENPWYTFGNSYTRASVESQVTIARQQKIAFTIIELVIPFLLLASSLALLIWGRSRAFSVAILATGALVLSAVVVTKFYTPSKQQATKIGIARWVAGPLQEANIAGFTEALETAGYKNGKNIIFVSPPASSADSELHKKHLQSLLDQDVALIFSLTTPGTLLAREMTSTVPIVFSIVTYPVESGLIDSARSSKNNLVGSTNWVSVQDQLAVFLELAPKVKRIGFVHRKDEPNSVIQLQEMRVAAAEKEIGVIDIAVTNLEELPQALEQTRPGIDALYSACDTLVQAEKGEDIIIAFIQKYQLPDFTCLETGVRKGSLIGSVADLTEIGRLAGEKAALILEGATPESLETSGVSRSFIYINQNRADELGISISQSLQLKAKEIIR